MKKNKDAWLAAEKVKRERILKEKESEIKRLTIKGLEP